MSDDSLPVGESHEHDFDDLLANNADYAANFDQQGFDGYAHAGVLMITCMDSRIDPLKMIGLKFGDAKIVRSPGGRVTETGLNGCIAGVHLLRVNRIMVVQHTRCAMASGDDEALANRVQEASGLDAWWIKFGADPDQRRTLAADVARLRHHPLLEGRAEVGGFLYDVDTGLLDRWF